MFVSFCHCHGWVQEQVLVLYPYVFDIFKMSKKFYPTIKDQSAYVCVTNCIIVTMHTMYLHAIYCVLLQEL